MKEGETKTTYLYVAGLKYSKGVKKHHCSQKERGEILLNFPANVLSMLRTPDWTFGKCRGKIPRKTRQTQGNYEILNQGNSKAGSRKRN